MAPNSKNASPNPACTKKLFNEMSTSVVRYHNVAAYDGLMQVMGKLD